MGIFPGKNVQFENPAIARVNSSSGEVVHEHQMRTRPGQWAGDNNTNEAKDRW
jgi:hypothetical protein